MFLKTFMVNVQNLVEGESQKKEIITLGSPLLRALLLIPIYRGVALSKKCWEKTISGFWNQDNCWPCNYTSCIENMFFEAEWSQCCCQLQLQDSFLWWCLITGLQVAPQYLWRPRAQKLHPGHSLISWSIESSNKVTNSDSNKAALQTNKQ